MEAELQYNVALKHAEQANLPEDCRLATIQRLVVVCRNLDHLAEAEQFCDRALAFLDQLSSENNQSQSTKSLKTNESAEAKVSKERKRWQADFVNLLGSLRMCSERYDEARLLYERALEIEREQYGDDHPCVTTVLDNLAALAMLQNNHAEAEARATRSLATSEKLLGKNHITLAVKLQNIAYLYCLQQRYKESETTYKRALAILDGSQSQPMMDDIFGPKRFDGDTAQWRTESLYTRSLGEKNPTLIMTIDGLAELYMLEKRYAEAEPLYQRVLALQELCHGPNHPNVASALERYSNLLKECNRSEEAAPMENRARTIRKAWQQ
jgi:tetratricopeptide (TPR) repeat protein